MGTATIATVNRLLSQESTSPKGLRWSRTHSSLRTECKVLAAVPEVTSASFPYGGSYASKGWRTRAAVQDRQLKQHPLQIQVITSLLNFSLVRI